MTFAVVAAAFVLGPQLSVSLLIFIIFVFTVVTLMSIGMTMLCFTRTSHLLEAERALAGVDESVREYVPQWVLQQTWSTRHLLTPIYVVGYVGTVIYTLIASGLI